MKIGQLQLDNIKKYYDKNQNEKYQEGIETVLDLLEIEYETKVSWGEKNIYITFYEDDAE